MEFLIRPKIYQIVVEPIFVLGYVRLWSFHAPRSVLKEITMLLINLVPYVLITLGLIKITRSIFTYKNSWFMK